MHRMIIGDSLIKQKNALLVETGITRIELEAIDPALLNQIIQLIFEPCQASRIP